MNKLLILVLCMLFLPVAFAVYNSDHSCIYNTSCDIVLTYLDDNDVFNPAANCYVNSWHPNNTAFITNGLMSSNATTHAYNLSYTPTMEGLYYTNVKCNLSGNYNVTKEVSFISAINMSSTSDAAILTAIANVNTRISQQGGQGGVIISLNNASFKGAKMSSKDYFAFLILIAMVGVIIVYEYILEKRRKK